MRDMRLGRIASLSLNAAPSALAGSAVLWAAFSAGVVALISASAGPAPLGLALVLGMVFTLLHWLSELAHQLGHAYAARRTGHPMIGVRFWGILGTSLYPGDEPSLPAAVHVRRALGGPIESLGLMIVAGLGALALAALGGPLWWLVVFLFADNLLLAVGSLLPLGFTDGSTLLRWRRRA